MMMTCNTRVTTLSVNMHCAENKYGMWMVSGSNTPPDEGLACHSKLWEVLHQHFHKVHELKTVLQTHPSRSAPRIVTSPSSSVSCSHQFVFMWRNTSVLMKLFPSRSKYRRIQSRQFSCSAMHSEIRSCGMICSPSTHSSIADSGVGTSP